MTSYVTDGNRTGFDQWAKKNNLKEAAKTLSYLSQYNLLNYEEFQNHISDLEASIHAADNNIQQTRLAIQNQKVIQKHREVYRACRDVILAEKDAPDRLLYRKQHRAEYQLHETTLKELAVGAVLPCHNFLASPQQCFNANLCFCSSSNRLSLDLSGILSGRTPADWQTHSIFKVLSRLFDPNF